MRSRARDATIYVLNGFTPDWGDGLIEINARPVINSTDRACGMGCVRQRSCLARRRGASCRYRHASARHYAGGSSGAGAARTNRKSRHCAIAEPPRLRRKPPIIRSTPARSALFRELHMLYPGIPASLANSSGIFLGSPAHFDMARPGAALYGVNPTPGRPNPMQSVVELTGRILQIAPARARRHGRLRRRHGRQSARPASPWLRSAMPTGSCAPAAARDRASRRRRDRRRQSAARSSAASRWIWSASTSPTLPTAPSVAATTRR